MKLEHQFCRADQDAAVGAKIESVLRALTRLALRCNALAIPSTIYSTQMAVQLAQVFGGGAANWRTQQAHYDLAPIRTDHIKLKRLELA